MDRQDPNSEEEKRRAYDRLRKILDAGEESGEGLAGLEGLPLTGGESAGPDLEDTGPVRLNPEDSESSGGAQVFLTPDPAHPAAAGFEEILESEAHLPAEPPVDTSELPTGEYRAAERHPTGQPESTGGWYGEAEAPTVAIPGDVDEDATRVIPPRHAEDDLPTQPVKVRHHGQRAGATRPSEPLPQRVDEVDPNATRVTPSAYGPTERGTRPGHAYNAQAPLQPAYTPQKPTYYQPGTPPIPPAARTQRRKNGNGKRGWGCFLRGLVGLLFVAAIAVLCVGSIGVYQYFRIASSLPPAEELRTRSSQFETTRILDRNGNLLYEILDPNAGRRTYVPLNKISPYLIAATIATEDKEFWNHPGYDPVALVRALWQNYTSGEVVSGASTITQQLARALLLPEEQYEITLQRKAREIVLAAEITRRFSKDEILELYLNENYYGNLSYGIEAASETYFNASAERLTLAQASFLAGLPQAPGVYDIYTNRDATLNRHKAVLTLMYQATQEQDCIDVGRNGDRVCVDAPTAQAAAAEIEAYNFTQRTNAIKYPHWVMYIRSLLESQYDAQTIYRSGFTVYTTLDPGLQELAEQVVRQQVDALAPQNVTDGALVAIRPSTGEILAMVGSADFNNEAISGQVNMAVSPRQPGSSIKPLTYVAAFEKGWTPATLIWDVPSQFPPSGDPNDPSPAYAPQNYDGAFHGPVTVRAALANSFNVPAVKTLQFVGIYDNPNTAGADGFVNFAQRLGITTLTRPDYGLSLTLGGGEVTVLDMTSAFGVFANGGQRLAPVAITRITDYNGNVVMEYSSPEPQQVVRAEHAYLISSILSDNEARTPMFGANSVLNLPFQVAVKTGTTNDFRDNWTIGYTPDLVTGVWVGNADYTPMVGTTGLTGAAPIWSQFMQMAVPAVTGGQPRPFSRPQGIVDKVICASSGTEPSEFCPSQRGEIFAVDQPPLPAREDLWQKVNIDTWTGLRASAACSDFTDEQFSLNVTDKSAQDWIRNSGEGRAWASAAGFDDPIYFTPERECRLDDPRPTIAFAGLNDNQTINESPLDIYGVVFATQNFRDWRLEWGVGDDPLEWKPLIEQSNQEFRDPQKLYTWDMKDVPPGEMISLRLYMNSTQNTFAERKIRIRNMAPTITPTPTVTATETEIPSLTPTVTETPVPSPTNTQEVVPTVGGNPTGEPTQQPTQGGLFDFPLPPIFRFLRSATPTLPAPVVDAPPTETPQPPTAEPPTPEPTITETATPDFMRDNPPAEIPPWVVTTETATATPACPLYLPPTTGPGTPTVTMEPFHCTLTPTPTLTGTPRPLIDITIPGLPSPKSIWDWLFGK
ncbi:MAG TPA: transglycosylase domain-containing protein [Anaerolineaceae bacterium]